MRKEIIEQKIEKLRFGLLKYDFDLISTIHKGSKLLGDYTTISFKNKIIPLVLDINFWINQEDITAYLSKDEIKESMYLNQICEEENIPLKDYLKKNPNFDEEEYLDNFIRELLRAIDTDLNDYFTGKRWRHTPIDWKDFK